MTTRNSQMEANVVSELNIRWNVWLIGLLVALRKIQANLFIVLHQWNKRRIPPEVFLRLYPLFDAVLLSVIHGDPD